MKKRFLRSICAIVMCAALFAAGLPAYADTVFSDLEGHWSESYMLDLVSRGYMSGYTDGTIKPEKELTAAEAVALLSKLYSPTSYQLSAMTALYGAAAGAAANAAGVSWVSQSLVIALGVGIIGSDELVSLRLSAPIEKERLAVFMARAMQLDEEAEALISVPLSFTDVYDISPENRCYVYVLVRSGVITGGASGAFSPKLGVTRAVAAAMLSRGISWLEKNGGMPQILGYEKTEVFEGIAAYCGADGLRLMGFDGVTRLFPLSDSFSLTVGGAAAVWQSKYAGTRCTVTVSSESGAAVSAALDSTQTYKYGSVLYVQSSSGTRTVTISTGSAIETVELATSVPVYINGAASDITKAPTGGFAVFTMAGGLASSVRISGAAELSGVISDITYGGSAVFLLEKDGATYYCEIAPGNLPSVYRGTQLVDLTRLKKGDEVTVTLSAGFPTVIKIIGSAASVSGKITKIATVSTGAAVEYTLTVELSGGTVKLFAATDSTPVYEASGAALTMSALAVGDSVSLSTYAGETVEITKTGAAVSAVSGITGTVVGYSSAAGELTLNVDGVGWVYVGVSSARVIVLYTGAPSGVTQITAGSTVTAYGVSSDSYHCTANVVYIH